MASATAVSQSGDTEIDALAEASGGGPAAVMEVLRALQSRYGRLTKPTLETVARVLHLPAVRVYGLATFYAMLASEGTPEQTIRVCDGPCCALRGAGDVWAKLQTLRTPPWTVSRTSCLGLCDRAPAALVGDRQVGPIPLERAAELYRGWCGPATDYRQPRPGEIRVLLPDERAAAAASGAAVDPAEFPALQQALSRSPAAVLEELEASQLRGRGGAGYPAGRKWRLVAQELQQPKYVVCNADESEPLSFKDRVLLELAPERVLEGLLIVAYAVGAATGFVYIRGEYAAQATGLAAALERVRRRGWLGARLAGTPFSCDIHIHRGAGAYICGEETALLEALEGKRGEPRVRPPFPTTCGYLGAPTALNNVETLAAVPPIILRGSTWFRGLGNPRTPGTKLYTLLGAVNRPGLVEAPYGLTLRQLIDEFAGGLRPGSEFRFALTGGAAGTFVPPALLDVPLDYEAVAQGLTLGSGGILIGDQRVSPVAVLRDILAFFEYESCGKCTPCRHGVREARLLLDRILAGTGDAAALDRLARLARLLQATALCGLGSSVARPIQSARRHFPECFATFPTE